MSVSEALNDLYSSKESNIKRYDFRANYGGISYTGDLTFSDTKWVIADKETRKCTGSGDNQTCDFSRTGGKFETTLTDFNASRILGGRVCFNAFNYIYDSGIRIRKGYSAASTDASMTYAYYPLGICAPVNERMYMNNVITKLDNEKYSTSIDNYIEAHVDFNGRISFDFAVEQAPNYNGNYSNGSTNSIFEIMGTYYSMWGEIYYQ